MSEETGSLAAVVVSALALTFAAVSLRWNVYRETVLEPRVRVRGAVEMLKVKGRVDYFLAVHIANHGPGEVVISSLAMSLSWATARLLHPSPDVPQNKELFPKRLAAAESTIVYVSARPGYFGLPRRIAAVDSEGRLHWTPRGNLDRLKEEIDLRQGLRKDNEPRFTVASTEMASGEP